MKSGASSSRSSAARRRRGRLRRGRSSPSGCGGSACLAACPTRDRGRSTSNSCRKDWKNSAGSRDAIAMYRVSLGGRDARKFRTQAAEMVASRPDVIVAITTPAVAALRRETRDIPLIFANMSDPVDGGYVQSMARPGGNITSFTSFEYSIGGKWVELLREAVASLRRVLVLYNPDNYTSARAAPHCRGLRRLRSACR